MTDSVPLEKQLLHLTFDEGLNEIVRPETADPSKTLTRVENLIQFQDGAFIKRPGRKQLGVLDDNGDTITYPTKLVQTLSGVGVVTSDGVFRQYKNSTEKFIRKGRMPKFVVDTADFITGSKASPNPSVYAVASSTKFHALLSEGLAGGNLLSIYDRESGFVVERYDMTSFLAATMTIAFVDDRYLHILFTTTSTGLWGSVIDTEAQLPTSAGSIVKNSLFNDAAFPSPFTDYCVAAGRSIVVYNGAAATAYLVAMDNSGANVDQITLSSGAYITNSGSRLWVMDNTNLTGYDPANFSSVLVPAGAHGGSVGLIASAADNIVHVVTESASTTFGGTTTNTVTVAASTGTDSTTLAAVHVILDGWQSMSAPFADASGVYVHLLKTGVGSIAPHVIADIKSGDQTKLSRNSHNYYSARLECSLEPMLGAAIANYVYVPHYFSYDGASFCPIVAVQVTARSYGFEILGMKPNYYGLTKTATFGGSTYLSGGAHSTYGGDVIAENGFADIPILNTATGSATGLTGAYKYIAVFKGIDETGAVAWSRVSNISAITLTDHKANITVCPPCVTNRDESNGTTAVGITVAIELYRTAAGGTQYYLCSSTGGFASQTLALQSTRFYTVTDSLADATLVTEPLLFRQPGTPNSALDRYPPPPGNIICSHKDRLFTTDPLGQRVYYSSFFVDGETAWYHPQFSFFAHGGNGPITGLVSMDGRLFVFKRNTVFVVDGDGPSEGGVTGNEFSPPQRLATEYGCIDQRSLCVTTEGIIYRSVRGIELLTRSLQVKWIGDRIQSTVNANKETLGVAVAPDGCVHILMADEYSGPTANGATGVEAVWDISSEAWSVYYNYDFAGNYGRALQDVISHDVFAGGVDARFGETLLYADTFAGVSYADFDYGADVTNTVEGVSFVPWVLETGWIRTGQQARMRVSEAMLLAKKNVGANHAIKLSLAYNFSDTYTQTKTFQPGVINAVSIEELNIQPGKQSVIAVRMKMEEVLPSTVPVLSSTDATPIVVSATGHGFPDGALVYVTGHTVNVAANGHFVVANATDDTFELTGSVGSGAGDGGADGTIRYDVGTGRGCDVLGVTFEIAAKNGTPKLAAVQKG